LIGATSAHGTPETCQRALRLLVSAKRDPVSGCNVLMDQQALNGLCECYGVARQIVEEGGVTSRVARSNRLRITVEVHSVTLPPDLPADGLLLDQLNAN
jgi:hypothetical protein